MILIWSRARLLTAKRKRKKDSDSNFNCVYSPLINGKTIINTEMDARIYDNLYTYITTIDKWYNYLYSLFLIFPYSFMVVYLAAICCECSSTCYIISSQFRFCITCYILLLLCALYNYLIAITCSSHTVCLTIGRKDAFIYLYLSIEEYSSEY